MAIMNTGTFTYRVAYDLYASARVNKNLIPRPGTITLDESGTFTLTDTSNQQIIIQKPFTELAGVRPVGYTSLTPGRAIIYIGNNEAYTVTFFSKTAQPQDTMDIYQKLLQGDKEAAISDFKLRVESNKHNRAEGKVQVKQANTDYKSFLATAKQLGVYKSPYSSAMFVIGMVLVAFVVGSLLWAFLLAR